MKRNRRQLADAMSSLNIFFRIVGLILLHGAPSPGVCSPSLIDVRAANCKGSDPTTLIFYPALTRVTASSNPAGPVDTGENPEEQNPAISYGCGDSFPSALSSSSCDRERDKAEVESADTGESSTGCAALLNERLAHNSDGDGKRPQGSAPPDGPDEPDGCSPVCIKSESGSSIESGMQRKHRKVSSTSDVLRNAWRRTRVVLERVQHVRREIKAMFSSELEACLLKVGVHVG